VIVGPTASGKTALGVRLAKRFGGEIISADSRAIYRGLNIGTAKPTLEEREGIPHWGIDIVGPDERFTVVDFQRYARRVIDEIRGRGHIPFLVGGTGLYIDSVVYEYQFPDTKPDPEARHQLESLSLEELYEYCTKNNIPLPENKRNKRYVVNNILRKGRDYKRSTMSPTDAIIVGIATERKQLWTKITDRAQAMWRSGLVGEATSEAKRYGWGSSAMSGTTYKVVKQYIDGAFDELAAIERIAILDRQLAKRQLTWLRRNEHIVWLDSHEVYTYIARMLAVCSKS
jgi:tRNA dimethylallyltransferase